MKKNKKENFEIWSIEKEFGEPCGSVLEALDNCMEYSLYDFDTERENQLPKNWLIIKNGKLLRTVKVTFEGALSWVIHNQ